MELTYEQFKERITPIERDLIARYENILKSSSPRAVLEIGSGWGLFSRTALEYGKDDPQFRLVTIDKQERSDLKEFEINVGRTHEKMFRIQEDSKIAVPKLDTIFDFIFVDGDHGYEGVLADLKNAWPKLKIGGFMLMDDILHKNHWKIHDDKTPDYGIVRAVSEFFGQTDKCFDINLLFFEANGLLLLNKKYD